MLVKNRPELSTSMSAGAILFVLVLFGTLGQAPLNGQQRKETLTCQSQLKVIPCKDWRIPPRITPLQADIGPHSLTSRVSSHTHVSLLFFNPVSVTSTIIGGAYLLFLLGAITWTIITLVWIVCTAVVSQIIPSLGESSLSNMIVQSQVSSGKVTRVLGKFRGRIG